MMAHWASSWQRDIAAVALALRLLSISYWQIVVAAVAVALCDLFLICWHRVVAPVSEFLLIWDTVNRCERQMRTKIFLRRFQSLWISGEWFNYFQTLSIVVNVWREVFSRSGTLWIVVNVWRESFCRSETRSIVVQVGRACAWWRVCRLEPLANDVYVTREFAQFLWHCFWALAESVHQYINTASWIWECVL